MSRIPYFNASDLDDLKAQVPIMVTPHGVTVVRAPASWNDLYVYWAYDKSAIFRVAEIKDGFHDHSVASIISGRRFHEAHATVTDADAIRVEPHRFLLIPEYRIGRIGRPPQPRRLIRHVLAEEAR